MHSRETTDNALMKSLASGDREALGTLFARHHQTVYALCVRLCGSEAAGEDVTQDVFLPVLERAGTFSAGAQFSTWLYRVTRNACLDYQRNLHRELDRRHWYAAVREDPHSESQL